MHPRPQLLCNPKQQIFKGAPGTILVCPKCQQRLPGIHYPWGVGLLTLPPHHDPYGANRSVAQFGPDRVFRRRSTSR
jgi:hypothetical protein